MRNLSATNLIFIGSCLFFVGSAIFTFEAVVETIALASIRSFFQLIACLFFTIGSILFIYSTRAR